MTCDLRQGHKRHTPTYLSEHSDLGIAAAMWSRKAA